MSLDPKLLEILACPRDKGPLEYLEDEQVLVNPRLKIAYRIDEGIPVMLSDEAIAWDKYLPFPLPDGYSVLDRTVLSGAPIEAAKSLLG